MIGKQKNAIYGCYTSTASKEVHSNFESGLLGRSMSVLAWSCLYVPSGEVC